MALDRLEVQTETGRERINMASTYEVNVEATNLKIGLCRYSVDMCVDGRVLATWKKFMPITWWFASRKHRRQVEREINIKPVS